VKTQSNDAARRDQREVGGATVLPLSLKTGRPGAARINADFQCCRASSNADTMLVTLRGVLGVSRVANAALWSADISKRFPN
jgi:hypothetical protein